MGFTTRLKETISFIYKAPFDNGLTEHEYDHVVVGHFDGEPKINPDEVHDWKWMPMEAVQQDIADNPDQYTAWFKIIFDQYSQFLKK